MAATSTSLVLLCAVLLAGGMSSGAEIEPSREGFISTFGIMDSVYKHYVKFHFFNRETAKTSGNVVDLSKDAFSSVGFNPDLATKIIIHGFDNNVNSEFVQRIKTAYLEVNEYNLIVVDWSPLCFSPMYLAAVAHMGGVAKRVAQLQEFLLAEGLADKGTLHIIGHSLGAHIAGIATKKMADPANTMPFRITALDPARPMFNLNIPTYRVTADDAQVVDAIHTAAGTLSMKTATGHIDFYPNGGKKQPGCGADPLGDCSHGRSFIYFEESIRNPMAFPAWGCLNEWDAMRQQCQPTDTNTTAYMGDALSFAEPGAYYLSTAESAPFGQKDEQ